MISTFYYLVHLQCTFKIYITAQITSWSIVNITFLVYGLSYKLLTWIWFFLSWHYIEYQIDIDNKPQDTSIYYINGNNLIKEISNIDILSKLK